MCWGETGVLEPQRTLADPTPRGGEGGGVQGLFVWTGGCASQPGHGGAASAFSRRFSPRPGSSRWSVPSAAPGIGCWQWLSLAAESALGHCTDPERDLGPSPAVVLGARGGPRWTVCGGREVSVRPCPGKMAAIGRNRTFQAGRRRRSKGRACVEREQAPARGWSRRGLWEGHDRRELPGTAGWQPGFGRSDRRWRCVSAGPCWLGASSDRLGGIARPGGPRVCRRGRTAPIGAFRIPAGRAHTPTCLRVLPTSSCSALPGTLDVCVKLGKLKRLR